MATDDEPVDSVIESDSTAAESTESTESPESTEAAPARPVRAAPLRRRAKASPAKAASSKAGTAKTGTAKAAPAKTAPARSPSRAAFVTVDRSDSRTVLLGLGAAIAAVVLVVASVLLAVGGYRLQQRTDLRAEYDAFAQQVTVNLTSLNKSNVDDIRKTLLDKTSGTAYENLQTVTQQIITQIEQYGIQTQGRVLSSAVTEADPDYGKVLMVLGWTQRIGNKQADVESQVFRWRVEMRRINGVLKLTKFDWVY